jgi:hypothetical protein
MEPIKRGEAITLDDGKEYAVVDIVYDNNCKYIYLARDEGKFEVLLGKEIIEGDDVIVETLDDKEEIKRVITILADRYKDIISSVGNTESGQ